MELVQLLGALDVAIQSCGVAHVQAAAVDVGAQKNVFIGDGVAALQMGSTL